MTAGVDATVSEASSARGVFTQFSQFLVGNAAALALSLLSFPILTRLFTKEQYGIVGLATTILAFGTCLGKAGLSDGIIRIYAEYRDSMALRSIFSSTVFFHGVLVAVAGAALYVLLIPMFLPIFKLDRAHYASFAIIAVSMAIRPIANIVVSLTRVTGRTLFLNLVNVGGKILALALSVGFFLQFSHSIPGYFLGGVLAELLIAAVLYQWFFRNYRINIRGVSADLTRKLITFGMPLLMMEISYDVLSYGDRFIIASLSGTESLGVYTVGYNLAMYLANLMTFPLGYAILPHYVSIYQKYGIEKTQAFLNRCLHYYLIAVIPICAGFYVVADTLFVTVASTKYQAAAAFSPLILVANLSLGLNNFFEAGLYLQKRTVVIMGIMGTAGVCNIAANLVLVPRFGLMGAATATLMACLLTTGLTAIFSAPHLSLRVDFARLPFHLFLSLVMLLVVRQIILPRPYQELILRVAVGSLIVGAGVLAREKALLGFLRGYLPKK